MDISRTIAVFTLNNLAAFVVWALAGVAIAALLRGDTAHRNLNLDFGFCLIAVGIWMIWPAMLRPFSLIFG